MKSYTFRRTAAGIVLVASGLAAGGALVSTGVAQAASTTITSTATSGTPDQSKSQRPDETLLTGTTAAKVRALAAAKYPTATIERVETDSDGVYEAHLQIADGSQLILQVGSDFTVTGTQTMGAPPRAATSG